jgi:hypothetical protein
MRRPPIPERFSSQKSVQEKKAKYWQIKEATASEISVASTTSEFIERNVSELSSELDCLQTVSVLIRYLTNQPRTKSQWKESYKISSESEFYPQKTSWPLKRQKRIIQEDIDDILPQHDTIKRPMHRSS